MSAEQKFGQAKSVPIFVVGESAFAFSAVQTGVAKDSEGELVRSPSLSQAFVGMIQSGKGIIMVVIKDKSKLADFAKTFQSVLKKLPLDFMRIVILSSSKEVLDNKALTQFPFIRTLSINTDTRRMISLLIAELSILNTKAGSHQRVGLANGLYLIRGDRKPAAAMVHIKSLETPTKESSAIVESKDEKVQGPKHTIIKGEPMEKSQMVVISGKDSQNKKPEKRTLKNQLTAEHWNNLDEKNGKGTILKDCIGSGIPTYIYDSGLKWKVRGYFSDYNDAEDTLTFKAQNEEVANKIKDDFANKPAPFLGSTALDKARVCTTLNLKEVIGTNVIFKAPDKVFGVQRRNNHRMRIPEANVVLLQFFDEITQTHVAFTALDISVGGVGLKLDADIEQQYPVGRKMKDLTLLILNREIKIPEAEIRHRSKMSKEPQFKMMGFQCNGISWADSTFIEFYIFSNSADPV